MVRLSTTTKKSMTKYKCGRRILASASSFIRTRSTGRLATMFGTLFGTLLLAVTISLLGLLKEGSLKEDETIVFGSLKEAEIHPLHEEQPHLRNPKYIMDSALSINQRQFPDEANILHATATNMNTSPVEERTMPSFQFPSPEERVKYYMGDWYNRTITDDEATHICSALYAVDKDVRNTSSDQDILYSIPNLIRQVNNKQEQFWTVDSYLGDALKVLNNTMPLMGNGSVVVLRIGDSPSSNNFVPVVCKSRPSCLVSMNMSPCSTIVWPIRMNRHFGPIQEYHHLVDDKEVVPWKEKKSAVIWRGGFSGVPQNMRIGKVTGFKYGPRVQAVLANFHYDESDIDVGFNNVPHQFREFGKFVKKTRISMVEQLEYKYILNVEGNDVSTGLKWQLASNSVVFMTNPTTVSFAMEDLLVPFVHYIPVKDDFSNVMHMVEWARSNDETCKWISEQATKFMNQLWISDEAKTDNTLVKMSLATRYQEQFSPTLKKCLTRSRKNK